MKKKYMLIIALLSTIPCLSQVEFDKKIELTGTGSDAKIEGILEVTGDNDAANKKYVDDAITELENSLSSCAVGGIGPGSGKIFYCGAPAKLEATPADLGNAQWGCAGTNISGTSTAFQGGAANTNLITANCSTPGIAARICADLVSGGKDDWYLPSKDELTLMFTNRIVIGGFTNGDYWSSSQVDSDNAWRTDFANGNQVGVSKNTGQTVRCIRSF